MDYFYSLSCIIAGFCIFYFTYKDGKTKTRNLTTSYSMHFNGYIGAIALIIIGIIWLLKSV